MDDIELLVTKDLKAAAQKLTVGEARYLVDLYYQIQEFRKATGNQIFSLGKDEPGELIGGVFGSMEKIEGRIKKGLDYYTDTQPLGQWAKSIVGIGPVITAGLLANIDFKPWRCALRETEDPCTEKKPHEGCGRQELRSVGSIWRFAGLDPTSKWNKGEKRPWNASLKRLCWLTGESFVKVSGNPKSLYGRLYLQRKALDQKHNDAGDYKDQAEQKLKDFKIDKKTEAYKCYSGEWVFDDPKIAEHLKFFPQSAQQDEKTRMIEAGEVTLKRKLPPGHVHERAKRWVVKLFLAHYFEEGCRKVLGKEPPRPYSIEMLGHVDYIAAEK